MSAVRVLAAGVAPARLEIFNPGAAGQRVGKETMAQLMKASAWGKREFVPGSIPDNRTIKRWVENGLLQGRIVDGSVWVCSSEKWGVDSMVSQRVRQLISED